MLKSSCAAPLRCQKSNAFSLALAAWIVSVTYGGVYTMMETARAYNFAHDHSICKGLEVGTWIHNFETPRPFRSCSSHPLPWVARLSSAPAHFLCIGMLVLCTSVRLPSTPVTVCVVRTNCLRRYTPVPCAGMHPPSAPACTHCPRWRALVLCAGALVLCAGVHLVFAVHAGVRSSFTPACTRRPCCCHLRRLTCACPPHQYVSVLCANVHHRPCRCRSVPLPYPHTHPSLACACPPHHHTPTAHTGVRSPAVCAGAVCAGVRSFSTPMCAQLAHLEPRR
jgi:hypothetical protein